MAHRGATSLPEHMASAQLRSFLGHLANHSNMNGNGSGLLVTTPTGQHHELGALMATITAALGGWNALYLGPNVPSDEIALTPFMGVNYMLVAHR
jgi:methanogenic corrinoid protein MtbC1